VACFDRPRALRCAILLLIAIPVWLAGYSNAQDAPLPLAPQDRQIIAAKLGSGVVGEPMPSAPITDVAAYFPLVERAATYQVTAGPHLGNSQTLGLSRVRRPNGESAWRFQFSPSLAGFIHRAPDGDLTMPAVGDLGEGVVVITMPANPFMLSGMKPGESRTYTQQVRVNALDDPADQKYSGVLTSIYTYVGTYRVTVPAGSYKAILLSVKCRGKVGPAYTHDEAFYFFAPGAGLVAMITQEDATAFWIIHIDTSSGKVLSTR